MLDPADDLGFHDCEQRNGRDANDGDEGTCSPESTMRDGLPTPANDSAAIGDTGEAAGNGPSGQPVSVASHPFCPRKDTRTPLEVREIPMRADTTQKPNRYPSLCVPLARVALGPLQQT